MSQKQYEETPLIASEPLTTTQALIKSALTLEHAIDDVKKAYQAKFQAVTIELDAVKKEYMATAEDETELKSSLGWKRIELQSKKTCYFEFINSIETLNKSLKT